MEDIKIDFLNDLGLTVDQGGHLDQFVKGEHRYIKDMRLNFKSILKPDHLTEKEIGLLGLALAVNMKNSLLYQFFEKMATDHGASDSEIAEALAVASLLASNNVLYRFRHFVDKEEYGKLPAKIRMNIMAKPVLEKEFFELISLAVSAVNGCEACVKSHEASVLKLGAKEERVWQSIRMASVLVSIDRIVHAH